MQRPVHEDSETNNIPLKSRNIIVKHKTLRDTSAIDILQGAKNGK